MKSSRRMVDFGSYEFREASMAWTIPEYGPSRIKWAGLILVKEHSLFLPAYDEALRIINNWRSSHSYPLNTFQMNLRATARRVDENALVAQRIKRLSSIKHKLERFPNMKLSQMQDIGGCRAIVNNVAGVRALVKLYEESRIKHALFNKDDYITAPRASGYRGIHLIYRYFSDSEKKSIYNGLRIEMQLRSRYQHAWATAVETVGTFVQQALKSSIGEDEWLRFFALMGNAIAIREKCPSIPGMPDSLSELISEIKVYSEALYVKDRLLSYNRALHAIQDPNFIDRAHFYLLHLSQKENKVYISGFKKHELEYAASSYSEAEKQVQTFGGDAVLVSVESLDALRRAYPNYFADTRVFLELLDQMLSGKSHRIYY